MACPYGCTMAMRRGMACPYGCTMAMRRGMACPYGCTMGMRRGWRAPTLHHGNAPRDGVPLRYALWRCAGGWRAPTVLHCQDAPRTARLCGFHLRQLGPPALRRSPLGNGTGDREPWSPTSLWSDPCILWGEPSLSRSRRWCRWNTPQRLCPGPSTAWKSRIAATRFSGWNAACKGPSRRWRRTCGPSWMSCTPSFGNPSSNTLATCSRTPWITSGGTDEHGGRPGSVGRRNASVSWRTERGHATRIPNTTAALTAAVSFLAPWALDPGRFLIGPEYVSHHADDLPQGGVGSYGVHEMRHRVLRALAGDAQPIQSLPDGPGVAGAAQRLQACVLPFQAGGIHLEQRDGVGFAVVVGVDPDDGALAPIDFTLVAVGRVGDLTLEESGADRWDDAPQLLDPPEVFPGPLFHGVGSPPPRRRSPPADRPYRRLRTPRPGSVGCAGQW